MPNLIRNMFIVMKYINIVNIGKSWQISRNEQFSWDVYWGKYAKSCILAVSEIVQVTNNLEETLEALTLWYLEEHHFPGRQVSVRCIRKFPQHVATNLHPTSALLIISDVLMSGISPV